MCIQSISLQDHNTANDEFLRHTPYIKIFVDKNNFIIKYNENYNK